MPPAHASALPFSPVAPRRDTVMAIPARHQFIAAISIVGALLAAGSCGLIADPLRHALALTTLLALFAAGFPVGPGAFRRMPLFVLCTVIGGYLSASDSTVVCTLGILVLLCGAAISNSESQPALRPIAFALFVFAFYRFADDNIIMVSVATDRLSDLILRGGSLVSGHSLKIGTAFAAIDPLILMMAFGAAWVAQSPHPRLGRALLLLISILAGHLLYLVLIPSLNLDSPLVRWNLPLLAVAIQTTIALFVLRWSRFDPNYIVRRRWTIVPLLTALLCIALPAAATFRLPGVNGFENPQDFQRQLISTGLVLLLFVMIFLQAHPMRIVACALLLAASISIVAKVAQDHPNLLPAASTQPSATTQPATTMPATTEVSP